MNEDRSTWQYKSIDELMAASDQDVLAANKRLREELPKYHALVNDIDKIPEEIKYLTVWCAVVTISRGLTNQLPNNSKR